MRFYVGYYKNEPCAASMLILRKDITDIHWVGTLPAYRKKGIGHAISHWPLHDIKNKVTNAILFASEMGKPLYESMGFITVAESQVYEVS